MGDSLMPCTSSHEFGEYDYCPPRTDSTLSRDSIVPKWHARGVRQSHAHVWGTNNACNQVPVI